jgi:hypothetical protein
MQLSSDPDAAAVLLPVLVLMAADLPQCKP